jgi:2-dehydro-3-deoxy-D-gluconate 5-dehydrogenase
MIASEPLFSVRENTVVITGASRGIGAELAVGFATAGANLVLVSRHATEDIREVKAQLIERYGVTIKLIDADFEDRASVDQLIQTLNSITIDTLILNAGVAERSPAEFHSDDQWDRVLEVDLSAQFRLTREVGRQMLKRGSGHVLWLASMMSWQGGQNVVSYAAAKSAVTGVVHALANEWAGRGVNVNALAPGYIQTDLTVESHGDAETRRAFEDRIPAGRWGLSADIVGPAIFLTSPAAAYVHGVVLPVDGGWLVR